MVAFITKQLLKNGYYEVVDDSEGLREESLVQSGNQKAMKTIYSTLMSNCPTSDAEFRIKRAQTILNSFSEEVANELSPPLLVEVEFSLNGKPIQFKMRVEDLNYANHILSFVNESLSQIKAIPDIQHSDLFERVFEPNVFHDTTPQTCSNFMKALDETLNDHDYIK